MSHTASTTSSSSSSSSATSSAAPSFLDLPPPYSPDPPPFNRSRSKSAPSPTTAFLVLPIPLSTRTASKLTRRTRSHTASGGFNPLSLTDLPPSYLAASTAPGPLPSTAAAASTTTTSSTLPVLPYVAARCTSSGMGYDSDDDDTQLEHVRDAIYTTPKPPSRAGSSTRLRARTAGNAGSNGVPKHSRCSETDDEDAPRRARTFDASEPIIPASTLAKITPWLFEFARWLSIVPSIFGALYNIFSIFFPPHSGPSRVDFFVSLIWCILTGFQCLRLSTGLLVRWRAYYPPLSTLIRLLALQAICWPATHFTLTLLRHEVRPVICWAVIGTTTCLSRAIQIWVTSNLVESAAPASQQAGGRLVVGIHQRLRHHLVHPVNAVERRGGRRWDWAVVGTRCALPAAICYFVMAWAEALRREFEGC